MPPGRRPSCLCGTCDKCSKREYDAEYRARTLQRRHEYQKGYRTRNAEQIRLQKSERAASNVAFIRSLKDGGCRLCDFDIGELCHFHHIDPQEKSSEVATMSNSGRATIMREVEKCVVLCPNCHAKADRGLLFIEVVAIG